MNVKRLNRTDSKLAVAAIQQLKPAPATLETVNVKMWPGEIGLWDCFAGWFAPLSALTSKS
ncbi:hypothetical protein SBV1_340052 [Verrucomicrobia bacterium]|nr:hypothetical protein SBV1_340052 [Verrucomicrobiota bacterium]